MAIQKTIKHHKSDCLCCNAEKNKAKKLPGTNRGVLLLNKSTDPTRTLTLRNQFSRQMRKRFRSLAAVIKESIITNDCFGLDEAQTNNSQPSPMKLQANADPSAIGPRQFQFNTNEEKIALFLQWLAEQQELGILEVITVPGSAAGIQQQWTDTYIQRGYERGVKRADSELKKAGYSQGAQGEQGGATGATLGGSGGATGEAIFAPATVPSSSVITGPFHADALGVLYTRAFNELKGVTADMDTRISRELADGFIAGENTKQIANRLIKQVGFSSRRAEMVARTELIRAHHTAMIQEFRNYAVVGVEVVAEFHTAGDGKVCKRCQSLNKKRFTLDEAAGLIPVHPNCRCVVVPIPVDGF